jgi:hypothetical protein
VVRVRAPLAALAVAALAALVGCGREKAAAPPRTASATATVPAAATVPIAISSPADGRRVRARFAPDGRLRVRARVRGTAGPGAVVFLTAACRPRACEARATAGADSRWSTTLTLRSPPEKRFVAIDARAAADESAPVSAVATVELLAPRPPSGAPSASTTRRPATRGAAIPPPRSLPHEVLVIGDSLAIGMEPSLRAALPGWRVSVDARIGRPLAEGMRILAAQRDLPAIVALSLFTNDDPSATGALERAVRSTTARPGGCAVWSTIVRPPYNGVSYAAANEVLERLAFDPKAGPRLQLVDWRAAVAQSPGLVAGDGVHGTPAGYRARGQLYAGAIKACAGGRGG